MKIIILDDDEQVSLRLARQAMEKRGHAVSATSDPAKFQQLVHSGDFDLQIVDHRLPNARYAVGLADGPAIVAVDAASGANIPTVFLTHWRGDCTVRMAEFDPRIIYAVLEKPTATDVETWAASIEEAIDELRPLVPDTLPESLGFSVPEMDSDLFKLAVEELHRLSEDDRDELEAQATLELDAELVPVWRACEEDWLKLQRVGETIMIIARGLDDALPSEDDVREGEVDYGSASLVVGRPILIEEFGGAIVCSPPGDRDWRRYPFVRMSIGEVEREFHVDTGSPSSFVSATFLQEAQVVLPRVKYKARSVSDMSGRREAQFQLPVRLPVWVDGPDGNVELSVGLQAVKNWWAASNFFNRPCERQLCPGSEKGQCGRRLGLVGRDLLYELPAGVWVWQLKPENGQFVPARDAPRKRRR